MWLRHLLGFIKMSSLEISEATARETGEKIGIDWEACKFTPETLAKGMRVELEHGTRDSETNVTGNDLEATAKIAWAHLKEMADYYERLDKMEKKGNGEEGGPEVPEEDVSAWLRKNPNPDDAEVHAWAEQKGWNTHKLEEVIYRLASRHVTPHVISNTTSRYHV